MQVVMLLYPRMTQLDLTGPYDVLARFEELTLHLVWKNLDTVTDSGGLQEEKRVRFAVDRDAGNRLRQTAGHATAA